MYDVSKTNVTHTFVDLYTIWEAFLTFTTGQESFKYFTYFFKAKLSFIHMSEIKP
jgi:hypothetical protein